jgi:hypothetical protein
MENIDLKSQIVEDTTGPNAPEIATTDENLSVDVMYQQQALPSLGRQIFSVIPMHGPTAALFNIRKKSGTENFELVRNEVEVYPSESIATGISQEAIQDLRSQYGKEVGPVVGTLLRGLSNDQENTRTLAFLEAQAKAEADLNLSDSLNAESNLMEITQKVHELVLRANSLNARTYEAFCVLPYVPGASIASLSSYVGGEDKDERGLFLAQVGQTKFFMNPDATSETAYVGLTDSRNPSKSSAVFSPYVSNVVEAQDPDSGAMNYFIFNRFAITASPLHVEDNEMLFKFDIVL